MHSVVEQVEIIGMMAAHESVIAELYQAYAARFPQHAEFFRALAAEEVEHARMIVAFADKVKAHLVHVNPGRFSPQSILTSLDYLRERVKEAKEGEITAINALSTATDLEEALIERRYFEIVEDDSPELKQLLRTLATETEAHRGMVRQAWENERR